MIDLPGHDRWKLATPPAPEVREESLSSCCSEAIEDSGRCAGCGEVVGECKYCGGEGSVEILHGSQYGREEPRTRVVPCHECQGIPDEPDYDADDYGEPDGWTDEPDYEVRQ